MAAMCSVCEGAVPRGREVCDACKPTCLVCRGPVRGLGLRHVCAGCRKDWKWCPVCEQVKGIEAFKIPNGRPVGWCYGCLLAKQRVKNTKQANKDYHYRYHLYRKFGITMDEARELSSVEKCQSCGGPPNGERLHVDHDHVTGEIRGVICRNCNYAIGVLEAKHRLEAVTDYLARWRSKH